MVHFAQFSSECGSFSYGETIATSTYFYLYIFALCTSFLVAIALCVHFQTTSSDQLSFTAVFLRFATDLTNCCESNNLNYEKGHSALLDPWQPFDPFFPLSILLEAV